MKIPDENDTFVRGLTGRAQICVFNFAYETLGKRQAKIYTINAERNASLFGLTLCRFGPLAKGGL